MTNETKIQAQTIIDAIRLMATTYEKVTGTENDELDSILYSVHVVMTSDGFDDAEILGTAFGCLQMATMQMQNIL